MFIIFTGSKILFLPFLGWANIAEPLGMSEFAAGKFQNSRADVELCFKDSRVTRISHKEERKFGGKFLHLFPGLQSVEILSQIISSGLRMFLSNDPMLIWAVTCRVISMPTHFPVEYKICLKRHPL